MIVNVSELEFAALLPDVPRVCDLPNVYSFFLGLCRQSRRETAR